MRYQEPEKTKSQKLKFSSKLILFFIFTAMAAYGVIDLPDEDYDYSGEEEHYVSETNS